MTDNTRLHHVNLMVDDLGAAIDFYGTALGLEALPTPDLGFPAQFFRINDLQEIHVNQLPDITPERAHFCLRVDDFTAHFHRMRALGVIETTTWGKARRLPSGVMQMFVRDPVRQPDRAVLRIGRPGRSGDLRGPVDLRAGGVLGAVIVLLETLHPDAHALLERADDVRVAACPTELDDDLPLDTVRGVLTRGRGRISAESIARLPNLVFVGRCGAGLDNIDTDAAHAAGVTVVYAPGRTTPRCPSTP